MSGPPRADPAVPLAHMEAFKERASSVRTIQPPGGVCCACSSSKPIQRKVTWKKSRSELWPMICYFCLASFFWHFFLAVSLREAITANLEQVPFCPFAHRPQDKPGPVGDTLGTSTWWARYFMCGVSSLPAPSITEGNSVKTGLPGSLTGFK